jgi:hypothetical protein
VRLFPGRSACLSTPAGDLVAVGYAEDVRFDVDVDLGGTLGDVTRRVAGPREWSAVFRPGPWVVASGWEPSAWRARVTVLADGHVTEGEGVLVAGLILRGAGPIQRKVLHGG